MSWIMSDLRKEGYAEIESGVGAGRLCRWTAVPTTPVEEEHRKQGKDPVDSVRSIGLNMLLNNDVPYLRRGGFRL
jgi:hypothetical protein